MTQNKWICRRMRTQTNPLAQTNPTMNWHTKRIHWSSKIATCKQVRQTCTMRLYFQRRRLSERKMKKKESWQINSCTTRRYQGRLRNRNWEWYKQKGRIWLIICRACKDVAVSVHCCLLVSTYKPLSGITLTPDWARIVGNIPEIFIHKEYTQGHGSKTI